jgi:PAS domain S-box-containing protein
LFVLFFGGVMKRSFWWSMGVGLLFGALAFLGGKWLHATTGRALLKQAEQQLATHASTYAEQWHSPLSLWHRRMEQIRRLPVLQKMWQKQPARRVAANKLSSFVQGEFALLSDKGEVLASIGSLFSGPTWKAFRKVLFTRWHGRAMFSAPFRVGVPGVKERRVVFGAVWCFSAQGKATGLLVMAWELPASFRAMGSFLQGGSSRVVGWPASFPGVPSTATTPGNGTLYASRQIGSSSLRVELTLPKASLSSPFSLATAWLVWVFSAFFGVAAGILFYFLLGRYTTPLRHLVSVAERIGQGDFQAAASEESLEQGEVGVVAESLQRVAALAAQREQQLQDLLNTASDAILSINRQQQIIYFNHQAETIFGYSAKEVHNQPLSILLPQSVRHVHQTHVEDFSREAGQRRLMNQRSELLGRRKSGETFPVEVSISKLKSEGEWLFTAIVRDVTERYEAEKALQEAHDLLEERVHQRTLELQSINEEMRSFTYIVSHDLRAPLVNLKGFAGELQYSLNDLKALVLPLVADSTDKVRADFDAIFNDEIPESMGFINSSSSRMETLINAILSLSRMGYRKLSFETISLEPLLQEVKATHEFLLEQKGATLEWEGALPQVYADRTSLSQMLSNLVHNAIKFLRSGVPGRIVLRVEAGAHYTKIVIEDNGRGIEKEDIPKVFELFRRVGRQSQPGEGMGLSYVRTLARRHGGNIWCESEPGKGTTFTFTLRNSDRHATPQMGHLEGMELSVKTIGHRLPKEGER